MFLIVDGGPVGPDYLPAHAHADIFSFELSLEGQRFVVDAGVFEYAAGEWRDFARSTAAHNTMTLDDRDQGGEIVIAHAGLADEVEVAGGEQAVVVAVAAVEGHARPRRQPAEGGPFARTLEHGRGGGAERGRLVAEAVMAAIERGGTVALANKEALVSAGEVMTKAVASHGATLLPTDSEHNAIFQCLAGNALEDVARITLTASGGPPQVLAKPNSTSLSNYFK